MGKIKNIIFDLGGVLLSVDFNKTQKAFEDLGVVNFADLFNQHHSSQLFRQLETGQISPKEFYNAFRTAAYLDLSDTQIENAWNALVGSFEVERLIWLETISRRYKLYLFSNTNQIHYEAFQRDFQKVTGKNNFDDYFIQAFYSHQIGVRKPDAIAFEKVLELANIIPQETVFIDDTKGNIEAAEKVGLRTEFLEKPKTIFDLEL